MRSISLLLLLLPVAVLAAPVRRTPTRRPTPIRKPISPPVKKPTPVKKPVKKPIVSKPTFPSVASRITKYSPGAFTGYRARSLKYVQSLANVNLLSNAILIQHFSLGCVFYATNGTKNLATDAVKLKVIPGWSKKTNWLTNVQPCNGWYGVNCTSGKIVALGLRSNNLTGGIPPEIALLSSSNPSGAGSINIIDLYNNQYLFANADGGDFNWAGNLGPKMQQLLMGSTSLYSTQGVPTVLAKLSNLQRLDCSYTLISGKLKAQPFSSLRQLQFINLDGNAFNSTIPTVFSTFPNLYYFYAQNAFLSGSLAFMKGMPQIFELWVSQNNLKGTLPTFLGSLSTLQSFSVSQNALSGSFPTQLRKLTSMVQMWFFSNKLVGTFPTSYINMTQLRIFHLENNKVKGNANTFCSTLKTNGLLTTLGVDCANGGTGLVTCTCGACCCSVKACEPF